MNQLPPVISDFSEPKKHLLWAVLFLVFVISAVVIGFKYWLSVPPKIVIEADAGFKKAKETINPEELRAWALGAINQRTNLKAIYNSMPPYVRTLYAEPPDISVDESSVSLGWGGGFFHWGIDVGSTNFVIFTNANIPWTVVEWVPGIYYGRE